MFRRPLAFHWHAFTNCAADFSRISNLAWVGDVPDSQQLFVVCRGVCSVVAHLCLLPAGVAYTLLLAFWSADALKGGLGIIAAASSFSVSASNVSVFLPTFSKQCLRIDHSKSGCVGYIAVF